jgi:hypothetical protein
MSDANRRAALEAAFSSAEAIEPEAEAVVVDEAAAEPVVAAKPDVYETEVKAAEKTEVEPVRPVADATPPEPTPETPPAEAKEQAPISWKPEEKTHWATIPKPAREAIQRRELEVQQALSRTAQSRKFAEEFVQTVSPYAHLIRAQNSTPLRAVDNLMKTAAVLMTGTQQQKAEMLAQVIENYAVDIPVLDTVLSRRPASLGAGTAALPPQVAEALKPVNQLLERIEQSQQNYEADLAARAQAEIARISAKPHFDDLREEMADLIELTARRGGKISLEDAYTRVLGMHPELKPAAPTPNANDVSAAAATLARAKRAGKSIAGAPASGSVSPAAPANRREAIARAWDEKTG